MFQQKMEVILTKCVLLERPLLVKQKLPTWPFRMEFKIFLDQGLFVFIFPSLLREKYDTGQLLKRLLCWAQIWGCGRKLNFRWLCIHKFPLPLSTISYEYFCSSWTFGQLPPRDTTNHFVFFLDLSFRLWKEMIHFRESVSKFRLTQNSFFCTRLWLKPRFLLLNQRKCTVVSNLDILEKITNFGPRTKFFLLLHFRLV